MRKQKRYTKRDQIVDAIEAVKSKNLSDCARAESLDAEAKILFDWVNEMNQKHPYISELSVKLQQEYNQNVHSAKQLREQAQKIRKRQASVFKRMERLKWTLSAFDTVPIEILPDCSVVMAT